MRVSTPQLGRLACGAGCRAVALTTPTARPRLGRRTPQGGKAHESQRCHASQHRRGLPSTGEGIKPLKRGRYGSIAYSAESAGCPSSKRDARFVCAFDERNRVATANLGPAPHETGFVHVECGRLLIARGDVASRGDDDLRRVKL